MVKFWSSKQFCGLRSLCAIPCSCMNANAAIIYTKKVLHTDSSIKSLFIISSKKSPRVTNSMQNIAQSCTVCWPSSVRVSFASPTKFEYLTRPGCWSFYAALYSAQIVLLINSFCSSFVVKIVFIAYRVRYSSGLFASLMWYPRKTLAKDPDPRWASMM